MGTVKLLGCVLTKVCHKTIMHCKLLSCVYIERELNFHWQRLLRRTANPLLQNSVNKLDAL